MNNLINNKFKDPKVTADGSDRVMGIVVFRWKYKDVPRKLLYTCSKLKKLPKPLKAKF
tara:strand:+ start:5245 stop:5418 length:174 start_codon:yes stop_codon:yes gene_type:complete